MQMVSTFPPPMYPPQQGYRPYRRHFNGPHEGGHPHMPYTRRFPYGGNHSYGNQQAQAPLGPDGKPLPPGEWDGKRMRKAIQRRTVDYNSSIIQQLKMRTWKKCPGRRSTLQPDPQYYIETPQPKCIKENPVSSISTRFVRTSTNKIRCPIFAGAWTPEGRRLVTGASSGEFTLWNGLTFNFETILQAHDTSIRTMEWSHNDMWLLSADHHGSVKYWQSNMNNVKKLQAHNDPVRGLSFSPTDNKFVTCSDDGLVKVWDFYRCYEERILRGHGADVKCVDWHPTKGLVVSGSKDSQQPVKLWDPKSGQSICTLHAHKSTVMDLQWNRNGNWLLTASRDHLIKVFDIRTMGELQVFRGHKKEATVVDWHPIHESMFASGGSEGSMFFWQVGCDKETGGMTNAHDGMIWMLQWHPLGHIVCTGSNDHTCKFWTRNRPGDRMKDKYNLNVLPPGSEEEYEYDIPNKEEVEANLSLSEQSMSTPTKADRSSAAIEIPGLSLPTPTSTSSDTDDTDTTATTPSHGEVVIPMLDQGTSPAMVHSGFRLPGKHQAALNQNQNAMENVLPMLKDVFDVPTLEKQLARFDGTSTTFSPLVDRTGNRTTQLHDSFQGNNVNHPAQVPTQLTSRVDGSGLLPTPVMDRRRLSAESALPPSSVDASPPAVARRVSADAVVKTEPNQQRFDRPPPPFLTNPGGPGIQKEGFPGQSFPSAEGVTNREGVPNPQLLSWRNRHDNPPAPVPPSFSGMPSGVGEFTEDNFNGPMTMPPPQRFPMMDVNQHMHDPTRFGRGFDARRGRPRFPPP